MCELFILLVLADTIAMTQVSGSVGHHGRKGCRLLCGFVGRNKIRGPHYYPALLRPNGFENHRTSSHQDVDVNTLPIPDPIKYKQDLFSVINSLTNGEYEKRRLETGIGKPSIFTRIPRILPLPTCFGGDLMHQPLINLSALLLDLWCARPDARDFDRNSVWPWAVLVRDIWIQHGKKVADATKFLPTSFGRPPQNPQEKISSGYKAWELLTYIYGLGPAVFFNIIPDIYYKHFCRLVRGIQIIYQRCISREQLNTAHRLPPEPKSERALLMAADFGMSADYGWLQLPISKTIRSSITVEEANNGKESARVIIRLVGQRGGYFMNHNVLGLTACSTSLMVMNLLASLEG